MEPKCFLPVNSKDSNIRNLYFNQQLCRTEIRQLKEDMSELYKIMSNSLSKQKEQEQKKSSFPFKGSGVQVREESDNSINLDGVCGGVLHTIVYINGEGFDLGIDADYKIKKYEKISDELYIFYAYADNNNVDYKRYFLNIKTKEITTKYSSLKD